MWNLVQTSTNFFEVFRSFKSLASVCSFVLLRIHPLSFSLLRFYNLGLPKLQEYSWKDLEFNYIYIIFSLSFSLQDHHPVPRSFGTEYLLLIYRANYFWICFCKPEPSRLLLVIGVVLFDLKSILKLPKLVSLSNRIQILKSHTIFEKSPYHLKSL